MTSAGIGSIWKSLSGKAKAAVTAGGVVLVVAVVGLAYWLSRNDTPGDVPNPEQAIREIEEGSPPRTEAQCRWLQSRASDRSEKVAVAAVKKLGEARTEAGRKALTELMDVAPSGKIRGEAAAALGMDKQADPQLLAKRMDPQVEKDPEVRAGAARGLSRLGDRTTVPQLFKGLSDPDPQVRAWSVTGLSNMASVRFEYVAEQRPEDQAKKIEAIGWFLHQRGWL